MTLAIRHTEITPYHSSVNNHNSETFWQRTEMTTVQLQLQLKVARRNVIFQFQILDFSLLFKFIFSGYRAIQCWILKCQYLEQVRRRAEWEKYGHQRRLRAKLWCVWPNKHESGEFWDYQILKSGLSNTCVDPPRINVVQFYTQTFLDKECIFQKHEIRLSSH